MLSAVSWLKPIFLLTLTFYVDINGISIPPNTEKIELTNELRELLFSSPSVLRDLRQVALQNDQEFVDQEFELEREINRWKRNSETDNKMAFAVAYTVMQSLNKQKEKNFAFYGNQTDFSLDDNDYSWTTETIQLVSRILDCRVDILNPYIKKCSSNRQRNAESATSTSGTVSCSVTTNSSVGCPPCSFSAKNVSLQSPNYPNDYQGPWNCEYNLEAAAGEFLSLVFEDPFVVEKYYDYLLVCDGETPNCNDLIRNITGYKTPGNYSRKDNKLTVKFVADDTNLALPDGKTGRWQINATSSSTSAPRFVNCTADPGCGTCVNVTLSGGIIQSSNYPKDNDDNLNCKISIAASPNAKILLTFTEFVVEEDYDFVMVYDSTFRMLREELTGYDIPVPFNVKTNNVTINFQTDANNWVIPNFASGNSGRWSLNFTVVYPTTATTVQSTTTSTTTVSTTTSSTTVSPANLGYTCTAECGVCSSLTSTGGIIQSPNYPAAYGNNRNCKIVIDTGSSKSRIALDFTEFIVEQDYDFVSVFDANQNRFNNLSGYILPDSTILKTTRLSLQFNSDENNFGIFSNLAGRWKATFSIISSTPATTSTEATTTGSTQAATTTATAAASTYSYVCEVKDQNSQIVSYPDLCTGFTETTGFIQSPNYPNEYPNNLQLTYKVSSTKYSNFRLDIVKFSTELNWDIVTLTDNFNNIVYKSGYDLMGSTAVGKSANLKFMTNGNNNNFPSDKRPGAWRFKFQAYN